MAKKEWTITAERFIAYFDIIICYVITWEQQVITTHKCTKDIVPKLCLLSYLRLFT